jgi:hypothetical protein
VLALAGEVLPGLVRGDRPEHARVATTIPITKDVPLLRADEPVRLERAPDQVTV